MKLEGELAFYHSNIGQPESQSFKFNDGKDLDSAGYILPNQKVKEYENTLSIDLKRNKGDLDLSPYDMESADYITTQQLDFSNCQKNDYEAQVRDFDEPVSLSSQDMVSFSKFPNDTESVKRSTSSPISVLPEEIDSLENTADVYMDKSVTECEPDLVACYKESNYHVIKDICVDEGVPTKDKILVENSADEKVYNFFPSDCYKNEETMKEKMGINVLNVLATEESDQVSDNHDQYKDLMQKNDDATEKPFDNVYEDLVLPDGKVLLQELDTDESKPFDDKGVEIEHNYAQVSGEPEESKNTVEEAILASPALVLAADGSNSDIMLPGHGASTCHFDPRVPAACGQEECHQVGGCKCGETQNTSEYADGKSDDQAITSQICHGLGESSFSAVGPVSSRISYSGPVPYSGSISLRSDSSTTSTRSFAFPILQSEWNSSPVRLAKADRKRHQKHRCWREGLLCCRF